MGQDQKTMRKATAVLMIVGGGAILVSTPIWIGFTIGLEFIFLGGLILDLD